VGDLHTQLLRHQEELEELNALYESEKSQNAALEEAVTAEKENFNKMVSSLDSERQRSRAVSTKDSDTIMELRTALEVEKEHGSRMAMEAHSPHPGRLKSAQGSRLSIYGSRNSLPGYKSPALIPEVMVEKADLTEGLMAELDEERSRCDRLKECLEIERGEREEMEASLGAEVQRLELQLGSQDGQLEQATHRLSTAEVERAQLLREADVSNEEVARMSALLEEKKREQNAPKVTAVDVFYVKDLESQIESYRQREEKMVIEMESLKRSSSGFPVAKSPSYGGSIKNIPQDPRDQSIFFYRKLLRAESYRKALVWQKRYLSLLLSSYQESEMLSLGRLARMSGSRRMLVAAVPPPQGTNVRFRVVVHSIIAISRMQFLVRRWKKTKKLSKKPEGGRLRASADIVELEKERQPTEEKVPDEKLFQKITK